MTTKQDMRDIVKRAVSSCAIPSSIRNLDDEALMAATFTEMGFDSLALMEFCVSVHLDTGVEMTSQQVAELATPNAVIDHLRQVT